MSSSTEAAPPPPITELSNELTDEVDVLSGSEFLRVLRGCDAQLFFGYRHFPSIHDHGDTLERLSRATASLLRAAVVGHKRLAIVMSGSGTSGRIAFLCARAFNRLWCAAGGDESADRSGEVFHYLISGGEKALFSSQEKAEDDPAAGRRDLEELTREKELVLFVGITCGLSAAYVAGQLDYAMHDPRFTTVLLGFNPTDRARRTPIEGWDKTFFDVASALDALAQHRQEEQRHFVLNPIVGPEAITGSSRMKGGSATKLMLETVFATAISSRSKERFKEELNVRKVLSLYEDTYRQTYAQLLSSSSSASSSTWNELVSSATHSLKEGGRVHYIDASSSSSSSFGLMAMVDASEVVPTYGARPTDFVCFLKEGWNGISNKKERGEEEQEAMKNLPVPRSLEEFRREVMPHLTPYDTVVILRLILENEAGTKDEETKQFQEELQAKTPGVFCIRVLPSQKEDDEENKQERGLIEIRLGRMDLLPGLPVFAELAIKWALNALSTGAFVGFGKVYRNCMIDMGVTNNKLFYRSINILHALSHQPIERCTKALLRSIYQQNDDKEVESSLLRAPISQHITQATGRSKVIPCALLLLDDECERDVGAAQEALEKEPIVRKIILQATSRRHNTDDAEQPQK
ncbi:Glucokinase regulator [Balamuthia mandrillaris]